MTIWGYLFLVLIMAAIFGCGARFGYLLAIRRQLRTACAWCKLELTPGREPTSHGICTMCFLRQTEEAEGVHLRGTFYGPMNFETEAAEMPRPVLREITFWQSEDAEKELQS
jgi:hypothetical protein